MVWSRFFKHLCIPDWQARRPFPTDALDAIEAAIRESEKRHNAELRVVIEASLHPVFVWQNRSPRERAIELFSALRVWDTEHNSGVLIYVQLLDRAIEIVADRGIASCVAQSEWDAICARMEDAFKQRRHREGALGAIVEITGLLAKHFPPGGQNPDELPNRPVVL